MAGLGEIAGRHRRAASIGHENGLNKIAPPRFPAAKARQDRNEARHAWQRPAAMLRMFNGG
jgi:hypothetical protein